MLASRSKAWGWFLLMLTSFGSHGVAFILRPGLAGTLVLKLAKGWHIPVPNLGVGGIALFKGCGWIQRLCSWVQKLYVVHITLGLLVFLVYRFEAGFHSKLCIDSIQKPELL